MWVRTGLDTFTFVYYYINEVRVPLELAVLSGTVVGLSRDGELLKKYSKKSDY